MISLTETAYLTRKSVNIFLILIAAFLLLRLAINGSSALWQRFFPPPPPPPTRIFGPLPYPNAQNNLATPASQLRYTLETPDGSLPVLPPTLRVYFLKRAGAAFGSFAKIKAQAAKLGFLDNPQRFGLTTWHFVDKDNPLRTLDIDEISGNFRLLYNFVADQSLFSGQRFTAKDQAISEAQAFLNIQGLSPTAFLLRLEAGALVPATALANTDAIAVTFNRPDIVYADDKTKTAPVVSPDFKQGVVSAVISTATDSKKRILEARFFVTPLDLENWGTYAPISPAQAWEKLKSGQAIYASLPVPLVADSIVIRKVYLAYLDPYPAQSYLQPVLVFSDEKGFVAYVPLVFPS